MWVKKINKVSKKNYVWNPTTYALEINIYLESFVNNLVITDDEITDASETVSINLNYKKQQVKWIIIISY